MGPSNHISKLGLIKMLLKLHAWASFFVAWKIEEDPIMQMREFLKGLIETRTLQKIPSFCLLQPNMDVIIFLNSAKNPKLSHFAPFIL